MHRIALNYELGTGAERDLHHPLMALLEAVHESGSIGGAAKALDRSYRHVWGELKRWETELGHPLVRWVKGQRAQLAPFGEKLLWAERRARARLAPQIESLKGELERAFAVAFDDDAQVIGMAASHDDALPALREMALRQRLHLDIAFTGSVDALAALNARRCLLAGFHALTQSPQRSPTARVYRAMLKTGEHKLIGFARRRQGLYVPRDNPLRLNTLKDLTRAGVRFANRAVGSGTRVVLDELLAAQDLDAGAIDGFQLGAEPSHRACAAAVASGSVDASFGIEAAAHTAGIGFVPIAEERYFLVTLRESLEQDAVRALLALLASTAWQERIATIPGYAAEHSGEVLSLRRVLPWWTYRTPKSARG